MRRGLIRQFRRLNASSAALAVVALAFALRVYRLGDKNIWWDEGWTVWLSQHDLGWIAWRTSSDEHPPLHYWLMHYWNLIGLDGFVGRFFSVIFGVLAVALLYRIGKQVGGKWLGVLAALLLAVARFHVWWSQDIKNYTLSGFFALAAVLFVLSLVSAPLSKWKEWELWLGYIASITIALYSHYLAALILLAANLFMFIVLIREWLARRGRFSLILRWSLAQLAVLALFAPWLFIYLQHAATWSAAPPFDFGVFLRLAATVLALGVTTFIENYAPIVSAFSLLALVGACWLFIRGQPHGVTLELKWGAVFSLLIVLIPPLLIYTLSLTPAAFFAPKIQARYLLILLPAYMLLLALGILLLARGSRYLAAAVLLLVLLAQGYTLRDYFQERVLGDDYTTLAQAVNSFALQGDVIVMDTDQEWPTLLYYLNPQKDWPWVGVPNGAAVDPTTAHRVAVQAAQYQGAWLVSIPDALARDPQHLVEQELAARWPKQYEQTFGNKRLTLYADRIHNFKDVAADNFKPLTPLSQQFDNRLRLIGMDLPVREVHPGDTLHVVTYWESQDTVVVETSLYNPGDSFPALIDRQETPISIGTHERAQADFVIPSDWACSVCTVQVQARLKQVQLGSVRVLRASGAGVTGISHLGEQTKPLAYTLGENLELAGIDLARTQFKAGDSIPLTLYWRARNAESTSYTVFVHLLGSQYNPAQGNFLWGQVDQLPVTGQLPTSAWPPGMYISDPYTLPIYPNAPPGRYKIEAGMYDAATGQRLRVEDDKGNDIGDVVIAGQVEIK